MHAEVHLIKGYDSDFSVDGGTVPQNIDGTMHYTRSA